MENRPYYVVEDVKPIWEMTVKSTALEGPWSSISTVMPLEKNVEELANDNGDKEGQETVIAKRCFFSIS